MLYASIINHRKRERKTNEIIYLFMFSRMNRHFLEHQMTEPLRKRRELNSDFYTRPIDDHFFDELSFYNRDFFLFFHYFSQLPTLYFIALSVIFKFYILFSDIKSHLAMQKFTFRINRIAVLCWVVNWTQRGSSSSSALINHG